ncbi:MAG TPA: FAD:protein FMN transferase [Acidimicrobiales bacterium]
MTSAVGTETAPSVPLQVIHHCEPVMGTVVTIDIYSDETSSKAKLDQKLAEARAVLQRADAVFSTWKPESPLSRLRRGELSVAQSPPEVAVVFEACAIARDISRGWFDPWAMPGGVDPTGYVKGWAAQAALDVLVGDGVAGAIVNAAGDIASFGGVSNGQSFRVGILNPFSTRDLACVVELNGAIATSGTYERGNHLIDPNSQRRIARAASASVCGPDLGLADALATALAIAGDAGLDFIAELEGYDALVISPDGWRWTDNFCFAPPFNSSSQQ